MRAEGRERVVRLTAGLRPEEWRRVELAGLLDPEACYRELVARLHPDGLRCSCGAAERIRYGASRTGYPLFRCQACRSVYSVLSGTVFSGTSLSARRLVLLMRLWADGRTPKEIAAAVGLHRNSVRQLQARAALYAAHGPGATP